MKLLFRKICIVPKLSKIEIFSILFCLFISFFVLLSIKEDILTCDECGYLKASKGILEKGLLTPWEGSGIRTYGYPLFLAQVLRLESWRDCWNFCVRWQLFAVQLGIYLCAAFFLRKKLFDLTNDLRFSRYFFICWNINVFSLIYISAALTDLLSVVLIYISLVVALQWLIKGKRRHAFVAGVLIACSVMVRPANIFLLPVYVILTGWQILKRPGYRIDLILSFFCLALGFLLPCIPQARNNYVHYKRVTPLVARDLGESQVDWGLKYLKYATVYWSPQVQRGVYYHSPWFKNAKDTSLETYFQEPGKGLLQVLTKLFVLIDMDLVFTYNKSLTPWYRWPGSVLSLLVLILGFFGLGSLKKSFKQNDKTFHPIIFAIGLIGLVMALGYVVTAIECRFGLPVLMSLIIIQYPFWDSVGQWANKKRLVCFFLAIAMLFSGLYLSDWIQKQSPEIQDYKAAH
jgi:hypothetical protein